MNLTLRCSPESDTSRSENLLQVGRTVLLQLFSSSDDSESSEQGVYSSPEASISMEGEEGGSGEQDKFTTILNHRCQDLKILITSHH